MILVLYVFLIELVIGLERERYVIDEPTSDISSTVTICARTSRSIVGLPITVTPIWKQGSATGNRYSHLQCCLYVACYWVRFWHVKFISDSCWLAVGSIMSVFLVLSKTSCFVFWFSHYPPGYNLVIRFIQLTIGKRIHTPGGYVILTYSVTAWAYKHKFT